MRDNLTVVSCHVKLTDQKGTKVANEENIKLWLAGLRSGQYVQGDGRLKQDRSGQTLHCCLGVACEVALQNGVELSVDVANGQFHSVYLFDNEVSYLPNKVQNWLGLRHDNPIVWDVDNVYHYELVDLNDKGTSFEEIADLIESNWVNE